MEVACDPWPPPSPIMELVRQEWLSWHHRRFALAVSALPLRGDSKTQRAIREEGLMAGLQGAHARMLIALQRTQTAPHVDPLLPHAPGGEEKDTRKELVAAGVALDVAVRVTSELADDMAVAARECAAARGALTSAPAWSHTADTVTVVGLSPSVDMVALVFTPDAADVAAWLHRPAREAPVPPGRRFGPVAKPLYAHTAGVAAALTAAGQPPSAHTAALPITRAHLRKLALLHVLAVAGVADPAALTAKHTALLTELRAACDPDATGTAGAGARPLTPAQALFLRRAWCVLARYDVFTGNAAGLQGAVTHGAFDALEAHLGVSSECFASPLNCHFPAYCSAFPDTDAPFGSRGNFHDWAPASGCHEANPPFVNDAMLAMAKRLGELVDGAQAAGGALAFFVIVPAWSDAYYHKLLAARARRSATLRRKEHAFIDGLQYRAQRATWAANVDSTAFLLATDAAVESLGWSGEAGDGTWGRVVASLSPHASPAGLSARGASPASTSSGPGSSAAAGAGAPAGGDGGSATERRVFKWAV
jgi:hypothetical protein